MEYIPNVGEICWAKCTTEGKLKQEYICDKDHMFIILTKKSYNQKSNHYGAVPITSLNKEDGQIRQFAIDYGIDIHDDELNCPTSIFSKEIFPKESKILCDKICRLYKSHILIHRCNGARITKIKLSELVNNLRHFIKYTERLGKT